MKSEKTVPLYPPKKVYIPRGNSYTKNGLIVKSTLYDENKKQYYYLK